MRGRLKIWETLLHGFRCPPTHLPHPPPPLPHLLLTASSLPPPPPHLQLLPLPPGFWRPCRGVEGSTYNIITLKWCTSGCQPKVAPTSLTSSSPPPHPTHPPPHHTHPPPTPLPPLPLLLFNLLQISSTSSKCTCSCSCSSSPSSSSNLDQRKVNY